MKLGIRDKTLFIFVPTGSIKAVSASFRAAAVKSIYIQNYDEQKA